jgi:hypothetical protein
VGDFFTPPPGFNAPPEQPEIKIPDLAAAAENIGIGITKSGIWQNWLGPLKEILVAAFAAIVGLFLSLLLRIFAFVVEIIGTSIDDGSSGFGVIIAATLHELFGVKVNPASVNTRRAGPDRAAVATRLGQAIIGTLFTAETEPGTNTLKPSGQAADNFLAVTMNMELAGWIEAWVTDGISHHILEKFGDLKDGMAQVLGLGRMSRQVFAPPIKVMVHDPYLALLEHKYRPKQKSEGVALNQFFRGDVTRESLSVTLGNQGYSEEYIDLLIASHYKYLPLADVDYLLSRGMWTSQDAVQYLGPQGYDTANAQHIVDILADRRIHKYRMELLDAAKAAYIAGDLPHDQWQLICQKSGLTDEETTWILKVAGMRRELKTKHLSEGEIIRGIEEGLMNFTDLRQWATREGMPLAEEQILELETQYAINKQSTLAAAKKATAKAKADAAAAKAAAAQQKAAAAMAKAADAGVSVAQADALVKSGAWTFDKYRQFLATRGYGPEAIDALVTRQKRKRQINKSTWPRWSAPPWKESSALMTSRNTLSLTASMRQRRPRWCSSPATRWPIKRRKMPQRQRQRQRPRPNKSAWPILNAR